MEENEELGWFTRYTPSKPMCNDVGYATQVWDGSQMSSDVKFLIPPKYRQPLAVCEDMKKKLLQEIGGEPHKVVFNIPNCKVSYKDGNIVVDELTPISEETAQRINKAFENLRMTMGNGFPMTFPTRKVRKYYKPKFTL